MKNDERLEKIAQRQQELEELRNALAQFCHVGTCSDWLAEPWDHDECAKHADLPVAIAWDVVKSLNLIFADLELKRTKELDEYFWERVEMLGRDLEVLLDVVKVLRCKYPLLHHLLLETYGAVLMLASIHREEKRKEG